jgi:hypothetical protein
MSRNLDKVVRSGQTCKQEPIYAKLKDLSPLTLTWVASRQQRQMSIGKESITAGTASADIRSAAAASNRRTSSFATPA